MNDPRGRRQIIALGGGGFTMEPQNPLLDRYILRQSIEKRPKICLLPTASGDCREIILSFYRRFRDFECEPGHLSLFAPPTHDIASFLFEMDILYVSGGNTKSMLAVWREWGLDRMLLSAWERGIVLSGVSAGSICWFEQGVTDSIPGELTLLKGLGILPGSNCPHFDGEPDRRPAYHRFLKEGALSAGYAADNGVGLHFIGRDLDRAVSSLPQPRAYKLRLQRGEVLEEVISPAYLGSVL
jgi:dipeptidase E